MKEKKFPRWIFAVIAIGGLVAAGIFLGIMSTEGISSPRVIQAAVFGLLGLLMFWGAYQSN